MKRVSATGIRASGAIGFVSATGMVVAFAWCTAVAAAMPELSASTALPAGAPPLRAEAAACGNITITHSSSHAITPGNSVSCNRTTSHTDNSYFRAFDLDEEDALQGLAVCEVRFGVEEATSDSGSQPLTVNLYTSDPLFPNGFPGSLTLIGTATVDVPDSASGSILSVPVTGTAPPGSQLAIEVFTPDGAADNARFFIGSNSSAEYSSSFLRADDCAIPNPATTAAIGFPNMHIVLDAIGNRPQKPACGSITITQSASQNIQHGDSAACIHDDDPSHTENSYYRAFDLAPLGAPDGLDVCQVQFGVDQASGFYDSQPVFVKLYTSSPQFPGGFPGSLSLIGFGTAWVSDLDNGTIVSVPVTGTAPAGSQLVVEVNTPDGIVENNKFFIGANSDAQSGPSYLRADDCGIANPTDTSAIGFPNMHIVINAIGNPPAAEGVIFADGFESTASGP